MKKNNVEAMLISTQANIYYVSGFYAEAGVATIIVTNKDAIIISDGRFMTEAKEATSGFEIVQWEKNMQQAVGELLNHLQIHTISIDQDDITYGQALLLKNNTQATLVNAPKLIEQIRRLKTVAELSYIRKACKIADESFEAIVSIIRPGMSEKEISDALEYEMRKRGATTCSFETIVASGPRGALPHGVASERILQKGDMVTMDFGALYHHYCSDITRTVALGKPNTKLIEVYEIVKQTQQLAKSMLKAGRCSKELEKSIREFIEYHGYRLIHGPGHSFGLEIHEEPFISSASNYIFEADVVVTLEPGIYIPGLGGVRIEDDFLVTKEGCEQLTHARNDLIILPF